jgi:hypothetical protein
MINKIQSESNLIPLPRMIDRQAAELNAMKQSEDTRVEKQVLEKELENERKRLEKQARLDKMASDVRIKY